MILKMNFNFNIKDMLAAAGQSIRDVTNVRDPYHTGKSGIKWECACKYDDLFKLGLLSDGPGPSLLVNLYLMSSAPQIHPQLPAQAI
jgi:hypothetical protein